MCTAAVALASLLAAAVRHGRRWPWARCRAGGRACEAAPTVLYGFVFAGALVVGFDGLGLLKAGGRASGSWRAEALATAASLRVFGAFGGVCGIAREEEGNFKNDAVAEGEASSATTGQSKSLGTRGRWPYFDNDEDGLGFGFGGLGINWWPRYGLVEHALLVIAFVGAIAVGFDGLGAL